MQTTAKHQIESKEILRNDHHGYQKQLLLDTNLRRHWLRKTQDYESPEDFHEYSRLTLTVAPTLPSVTSCPPAMFFFT